jgi:hypothetical protein
MFNFQLKRETSDPKAARPAFPRLSTAQEKQGAGEASSTRRSFAIAFLPARQSLGVPDTGMSWSTSPSRKIGAPFQRGENRRSAARPKPDWLIGG